MKAVFAAVLLSSMVSGVFLAPYFNVSIVGLLALFMIFFLLSLSVIPEKWLWISMIAIGFFFLGILRYQQYDTAFQARSYPIGEKTKVIGQVSQPPEDTKKATKVVVYDQEKKTNILLIMRPFPKYKYGETIQIEGQVAPSLDGSYKNNLASKGISGQMLFPSVTKVSGAAGFAAKARGMLFKVRGYFEESINKTFSEPESSFLSGLLLGIKRNLPEWLTEDLKKSGTTHLIALSGFNITVIIVGLRLILSRKSAKLSFYVPLLAIFGFVVMTGSQSSVVRAGIMGAMMLLAHRVGRQSSASMAIILTAAAMILINPYILRFDIGFQLSFLAFMGIIYIAPLIKELLPFKNEMVKEILSMTLGAQVMAYPILMYYFGSFSVVSVLVNFIVLPFIPIVMLLGFVSVVLSMIWAGFGYIFSWTAYFALHIIISIIHFSAGLSFSSLEGINISGVGMFIFYVSLLQVVFIYKMLKRRQLVRAR